MKRDKFISIIEEAIKTEETATTIYLEHLKAFSSRFGLEASFMKEFKKKVEFLITENKKHKSICESLLKQAQKDERDDI
jgi:rubrerythrin